MRSGDLGLVAHPGMSLRQIMSAAGSGGIGGEGLRVLLGEGTWHIGPDGLSIARERIQLVALSPGRTIFKRTNASGRATDNMVRVEADHVLLDGIRFYDESDILGAVEISEDFCTVRNCLFDDCYAAVYANGAKYLRLTDNTVLASREPSRTVLLAGVSNDNIVQGWIFKSTHLILAPTIYAGDTVGRTSFVGNVTGSLGVISYKMHLGNVDDGNTGTITKRP